MDMLVFLVALISVVLNSLAQVALRKTMLTSSALVDKANGVLDLIPVFLFNWWFLGGMACYVLSIGLWMFVLSKLEVSLAYPLLSIGYIVAAIIGYSFLGENVSAVRIAGIGVICVGILILSQG